MSAIEKKLKRDIAFNPFNDSFDYNLVMKEVEEYQKSGEEFDTRVVGTALSTSLFNRYYKQYYSLAKDTVLGLKISKGALIRQFFAAVNRDLCVIHDKLQKKMEKDNKFSFEDISRLRIESPVKEFGQVDPYGMIDTCVDILNVVLNFLRNYETSGSGGAGRMEAEVTSAVLNLYRATNLFRITKEAYDIAIWESGYVTFEGKEKDLYVRYCDETYPIICQVGLLRLQRNAFAFSLAVQRNTDRVQSIVDQYSKKKRIKSIYKEGNRILWHLSKGRDKVVVDVFIRFYSGILAYYPFIIETKLPHLNLSILELSVLFAHFTVLIQKLFEFNLRSYNDSNSHDFDSFGYVLRVQDVKQYLQAKTNFQESHINAFLGLLEHRDGRYDLWKKPLIRQNENYLFPLVCILAPNVIHLIDEWLEAGGYSLEKRGPLFENYIKKIIVEELTHREFFYRLANQMTFLDPEGSSEEIDLMLNLKHVVLVGEVKCIKHALEPRQYHDSIQRLKEGAEQAKRKVEFLRKNQGLLKASVGNVEGKNIIPAVFTNLPIFSGMSFHDVPVVDFSVFDSYISSGRLAITKIIPTKGTTETQEVSAKHYYRNEDEFSMNLRSYLDNPLPIQELKCGFSLEYFMITLGHVKPKIYIQIAQPTNIRQNI
jgi:hypothetical protein